MNDHTSRVNHFWMESYVCLTLFGLARYCQLRQRQIRQGAALDRMIDAVQESGPRVSRSSLHALAENDLVRTFIQSALNRLQGKRGNPRASLELLHRGLTRGNPLHFTATQEVVLGLLGTLLGLFIGFVLTFGGAADAAGQLHTALAQAVIVVATASVSSISGIGLGLLVVKPLAQRLDRHGEEIVDRAIAMENLLELQEG